jgi:putative transposase
MMCTLPEGDVEYPRRLAFTKKEFTKRWLAGGGCEQSLSKSRRRTRRRGVWQRKYWEHTVLDPDDRWRLMDYMHFNAVKHGLVRCPHDWPYSSFHRYVRAGVYPRDWQCVCSAGAIQRTDVARSAQRTLQDIARLAGE